MAAGNPDILLRDYEELSSRYGKLVLLEDRVGTHTIEGTVNFSAAYRTVPLEGSFAVAILVPEEYPEAHPLTRETGGAIPEEFHTHGDGSLCLGAPLDVRMAFAGNPTLLGYVDDQLVPFLYSYLYCEKYGDMPFGELSHGGQGILESYRRHFPLDSDEAVIGLLEILATGFYRGHHACPCGSGERLRGCHGPKLQEVNGYQTKDEFLGDLVTCADQVRQDRGVLPLLHYEHRVLEQVRKAQL